MSKKWELAKKRKYLYAGHGAREAEKETGHPFVGLVLGHARDNEISHDITKPLELPDGCITLFQAEDVFEHIHLKHIPQILQEVYRVLKPGGCMRVSVPDYRMPYLIERSHKKNGEIYFDSGGGGAWNPRKQEVVNGGHVWFPRWEKIVELWSGSPFSKWRILQGYLPDGTCRVEELDTAYGVVRRVPGRDARCKGKPMSLVIDAFK